MPDRVAGRLRRALTADLLTVRRDRGAMSKADVFNRLQVAGPQTAMQLARHFGFKNPSAVYERLHALNARGVVVRTPGARGRRLWDVRR